MVDKRTELSLIFVLVGTVFLVPVITGKALGATRTQVHVGPWLSPVFVEKNMDEGQWVEQPHCSTPRQEGSICEWKTRAANWPIPGPEAAHVIYNYYSTSQHVGKAKFWLYSPKEGGKDVKCGAEVLEQSRLVASCEVHPHWPTESIIEYFVSLKITNLKHGRS
jgi:hypothetical protein